MLCQIHPRFPHCLEDPDFNRYILAIPLHLSVEVKTIGGLYMRRHPPPPFAVAQGLVFLSGA